MLFTGLIVNTDNYKSIFTSKYTTHFIGSKVTMFYYLSFLSAEETIDCSEQYCTQYVYNFV